MLQNLVKLMKTNVLKVGSKKKVVNQTSRQSFEKLISDLLERANYGECDMADCCKRLNHIEHLYTDKHIYHIECYKQIINKTLIRRAKERHEKTMDIQSVSTSTSETNIGNTSSESKLSNERKKGTTISVEPHEQVLASCQESYGKLHKVESMAMGENMLHVAKTLSDQAFFVHLNAIPNAADAAANDVLYHLKCWVQAQREVTKLKQSIDESTTEIE